MGYNIRRKKTIPIIVALLLFLLLMGCGSDFTDPGFLGLADGTYTVEVTLEGGSGRSSIASPAVLSVQDGKITAEIIWSSPNYDFMEVKGERYLPVNDDGNSTFVIPVTGFDCKMSVSADTTAMSEPHLIDYTLEFDSSTIRASDADADGSSSIAASNADADESSSIAASNADRDTSISASDSDRKSGSASNDDTHSKSKDASANASEKENTTTNPTIVSNRQSKTEDADGRSDTATTKKSDWKQMKRIGRMKLDYATQFSVDYYGTYSLVTVGGDSRYLLIPSGEETPSNLDSDIIPIRSPKKIYLAASAVMDYFRVLGKLDRVRMTSTKAADWSLPEIVQALNTGDILYAGKYSSPDFELILGQECDLAIESTMIYHKPETKEKLETLGIPVFVDKSSYEEHPLGRMEWIRLYGVLLGVSDKADAFFSEQLESLKALPLPEDTPSVAYFYITTSGSANIRRPGDYISRMIELSGGRYAFSDAVDAGTAQATMNMQMEDFLSEAMEADILIYSTSIDGDVDSLEDFYSKAPLLRSSKAARSGNIWAGGKNVYQQPTAIARIMLELHSVISGQADSKDMEFLHRLT
ncbi:MAG: ABC transporter substrate-binding protein [Lachnospiraceae bacterium]|nr:ABC transporter substrate-binding protein [Lachnospiraceae bacterium]